MPMTRRGQTSTYFLLLMAVLLVLAMVMVNVGKVSYTRTSTSNAADAAALAASSYLASGGNMITDYSKLMAVNYAAFFASQVMTVRDPYGWGSKLHGMHSIEALLKGLIVQAMFEMSQRAILKQADQWASSAQKAAERNAYVYAFVNANIDDPDRDRFEQFMDLDDEGNGEFLSGVYPWEEHGHNEVRVALQNVNKPSPEDPVKLFTMFFWCVGVPVCHGWKADGKVGESAFEDFFTDFMDVIEKGKIAKVKWGPNDEMQFASKEELTKNKDALEQKYKDELGSGAQCLWEVPNPTGPGCMTIPGLMLPGFFAPVSVYIPGLEHENDTIEVTVTRQEPDADLRLWQMQYHNAGQSEQDGIVSRSQAKWDGGSTNPLSSADYEPRLVGVE